MNRGGYSAQSRGDPHKDNQCASLRVGINLALFDKQERPI